MEAVIQFLKRNGFRNIEGKLYTNGKCLVIIKKDHYIIENKNKDKFYSEDLNIYWLIGFLTFYDFIDKNYA